MVSFNNLTGALGSILGYLGGEVASDLVFQRLLWPERYYNEISLSTCLQLAFLMSSGGPLHSSALKTLQKMQENGLYRGKQQGNMLGTAFYRSSDVKYCARTVDGEENIRKDTRNGFLVEIARNLTRRCPQCPNDLEGKDAEVNNEKRRAAIPLHHLFLTQYNDEIGNARGTVSISEAGITWKCVVGVIVSESSSLLAAVLAGVFTRTAWLVVYFCLPVLFKLVSVMTSVERETIMAPTNNDSKADIMVEMDDLNYGLILIEGPDHVIRWFFRHYGHPQRGHDGNSHRSREVVSMLLVYLFVAYFPVGLIVMLWANDSAQLLWNLYQLYMVLAMHVARLAGLNGCGRTEENIARQLDRGNGVILRCENGGSLLFRAETLWLDRVATGRKAVETKVTDFRKARDSVSEKTG